MLIAATMVFVKTHPQQSALLPDPMSHGVYYDTVNMLSDDHVPLEGWLARAVDTAQVIKDKDQALKTRSPAVVLAHGFGMSRDQVLAFFKPLHDRGYVVLAVGFAVRARPRRQARHSALTRHWISKPPSICFAASRLWMATGSRSWASARRQRRDFSRG